MPTAIQKIDGLGRFGWFPGITTISKCHTKNTSFCENLYAKLSTSDKLKPFFSILPASSYHMTTLNLFTEQDIGHSTWQHFLDSHSDLFQNLAKILAELKIEPIIEIKGVRKRGVIQLIASLPDEQVTTLRNLGEQMGLLNKIPQRFHITLAYQFKEIPSQAKPVVEAEIESIINQVLKEHGNTLMLDAPKLSYFYDMTAFFDWDITKNPFHKKASVEITDVDKTNTTGVKSEAKNTVGFWNNASISSKPDQLPPDTTTDLKK